jgi:hypothetical protein
MLILRLRSFCNAQYKYLYDDDDVDDDDDDDGACKQGCRSMRV